MGCYKHCRKWTVLSFNFIFFIVGLSLTTVGAICTHTLKDVSDAIPLSYYYLTSFPIIMMVLGIIILLVSIFGTIGVLRKSIWILNLYIVILLVIFVLEIILSMVSFFAISSQNNLATKVNSSVEETFSKYSSSNKEMVDFLQLKLDCCGTSGVGYWNDKGMRIPESCYEGGDSSKAKGKSGCQNALYSFIITSVQVTGTTTLAIAPVLAIGAILSLSLVNAVRNNIRRYGKYYDN